MKIWFKYLIGIIFGLALASILPAGNPQVSSILDFTAELFTRFGCYILLPLIFSSALISVFKLTDSGILIKTGFWTFIVIVSSSLLLTLTGLLSALVIHLPRIPITAEKVSTVTTLDLPDIIRRIFPYSVFETLHEGSFLLPCFLFAFITALSCIYDKNISKPLIQLADSISKICYQIMTFFVEILSIGMIAIMTVWTIQFRNVIIGGTFTPVILMLAGNLILVTAVLYPAILYFLFHDPHPYRVLYASLASLFTAFFSGNTNLTLPLIILQSKDSLGIRRRLSGFSSPLFSIFARGGSALVMIISFITIWRSYSSLNLALSDILWITCTSFLLSFVLGSFPSGGTFFALTVLCTLYSRGFDTGYLLLKPAAPIIGSFAAAADAVTAMYGSYIISIKTQTIQHREARHFI
jgi:Na+/H+-dicarboxylate symporter